MKRHHNDLDAAIADAEAMARAGGHRVHVCARDEALYAFENVPEPWLIEDRDQASTVAVALAPTAPS